MKGTLRVARAETYRMVRSRTVWACAAAIASVGALRVLVAHMAENAAHATAVQQALLAGRSAPEFGPPTNAYAPLVEGWLAGMTLGTLLLLIVSARSLAGDRESGVLRLARTRSASRAALVLGRFLLGPPLVLAVVALAGLGAWLAAWSLFEFGPLVEDGYQIFAEAELRAELRTAVLASFPPLLATFVFGLFVSALGRTATGAVGVCLAVFLGFDLFKEALGDSKTWVFATYAPSLVDHSCMQEMAGIAKGYSDSGYTELMLRMNHFVPWPEAALLLGLTCWIVSRRAL